MDKQNTAPSPVEGNGEIENGVSSNQDPVTLEHQVLLSTSQTVQNTMGIRKNYKRAANRGKKDSQELTGKTNALKPSDSSVRVLRSASSSKTTPTEHVQTTVQPAAKRRKRGRPSNKSSTDEFSQIRKRVRYILNRMNYEQSLIEAYASEGWKNQSLDKIRPEKELERAKVEILRCKLRIREVFQNLDSLLSKGKIDESLFDSEGEIACEDIFCATCGSKDVTLGNDIILCDGACDRGFHQNCLNPPLRTEEIPMGDEGWLCPACDCKIDCIDVINELQGSDLSIDDSWEKVFPEAAVMANGSKQDDLFDLPSDDSDDNDFDPNMPEEHVASKEEGSSDEDKDEDEDEDEDGGSDSDDSNFLTSSDDSEPLTDKKKVDDLGLPSEDSEDDDYDPAGPDSDKEDVQQKKTSSDESDFTSDSDDFCEEIAKSGGHGEVSSPPVPSSKVGGVERSTSQANAANSNEEDPMETEMDQSVILPVSGRRQVERLDYKKLYDEAYGRGASDSSDDEEWSGKSTPRKGNEESDSPAGKGSRSTRNLHHCDERTLQSAQKGLDPDSLHGSVDEKHGGLTSNGSNSAARKGHYGPVINQKLHEHFKTEQYPSRSVKENLAEELGLTFRQVSKWFESRRHFTKAASSKKGNCPDNHRPENNNNSPVATGTQLKEPEEAVMEKPNVRRNKDAAISREVASPKVASRKNRRKNASGSDVRGSKVDSAEDQVPGLDLADKARQKAIQQELKKKKTGR